MKTSRLFRLVSFAVVLAALPLAAQVNDTYVIPVVGNVPGAFGTQWMSQFSLFNPQLDHALNVSVVFIPTGGGTSQEVLLNVPANSVVFTDNVLLEAFKVSNRTGSLLVATFPEDNPGVPNDVLSRSFLVTTNTFNNSPAGTFGQTIPGTWTGLQDYASDGISAVAHGIRHIARFGWRTNFGAVNLGDTNVTMRVTVYDADGRTVVKTTYTVPRRGHMQSALPVEVDHGAVEFFVDDPSRKAVVIPYTSTIDQLSGDPTYQSPTLLASAKVLFSKRGMPDPASLGRKITIDDARLLRAAAQRKGFVFLTGSVSR